MNMTLLGYREIVERDGEELSDIFYVRSFVRLWTWGAGYQVVAQQSGNGKDYFCQSFTDENQAQKVYDTVDGILAFSRKAVSV